MKQRGNTLRLRLTYWTRVWKPLRFILTLRNDFPKNICCIY
jgi:hypothetical protein